MYYLVVSNTRVLESVQVGQVAAFSSELDAVRTLDEEGVVVLDQSPDEFSAHCLYENVVCWFICFCRIRLVLQMRLTNRLETEKRKAYDLQPAINFLFVRL